MKYYICDTHFNPFLLRTASPSLSWSSSPTALYSSLLSGIVGHPCWPSREKEHVVERLVGGVQSRNALQAPVATPEKNITIENATFVTVDHRSRPNFACRTCNVPALLNRRWNSRSSRFTTWSFPFDVKPGRTTGYKGHADQALSGVLQVRGNPRFK